MIFIIACVLCDALCHHHHQHLQESGSFEILFNLVGFDLTPSEEQTAGFFTPDIALMFLSPDQTHSEWKNRSLGVFIRCSMTTV